MATTNPQWTNDDLQAVMTAIASGQLEVRFADRTIRYRSIDELVKAKNIIENWLFENTGQVPIRQIRIYTDGGW